MPHQALEAEDSVHYSEASYSFTRTDCN